MAGVGENVGHRTRTDAFEQGRDRGSVTQPRAVIDVVGPQPGPHELLEKVRLFVRALGRAEARERAWAMLFLDPEQVGCDEIERLVPRRFAERRHDLAVIDDGVPAGSLDFFGERALRVELRPANERPRQPLFVQSIVPAIAAFDAQPPIVPAAVAALGPNDLVRRGIDVQRQGTPDTAIRTDAFDVSGLIWRNERQGECLVGERASGAGRDAFAARHARALAHRVVEVERDPRFVPLAGPADDFVALNLVACPDAAVAEDAGLVIDGDDGAGGV